MPRRGVLGAHWRPRRGLDELTTLRRRADVISRDFPAARTLLMSASMKKLLVLTLLLGCDALDGKDHRSLTELGAVTAEVHTDLGAPWGTGTDDVHPGVSMYLDYTMPGCLSVEGDAVGTLDGRVTDYAQDGGIVEGDGHYPDECEHPGFYFDRLPQPRDVSTIAVEDGNARFTVDVPMLLVNPSITLTELQRGSIAVARVEDPRSISAVRVWFQSDYGEPTPVYWPVDATIVGSEIHFPVPSTARGSGTLGINLTYKEHDLVCTGFASCAVTVQAGASFARTFQ
jgi:hypothetical protein